MLERAKSMTSMPAPAPDLVLLCGGTEGTRETARLGNGDVISQSASLAVEDVQSLLRCAPISRAVIVCGGLNGMTAYTVERLIRQRAPGATLIRA
jgi:hypothetical protein